MTETTLTVSSENSANYLTIVMTVDKSEKMKLKSLLTEESRGVTCGDGILCTHVAVESAAFSGVFYALRQIGGRTSAPFSVVIRDLFGVTVTRDLTPCAIAAGIAVAYATGHNEMLDKYWGDGWCLVDSSTQEISC